MTATARTLFPDLDVAPFTLPLSRLLVFGADRVRGRSSSDGWPDAVTVRLAEYERSIDECVVIGRLRVLGDGGNALPVTEVRPERIVFGGRITLTFAGPGALSVGPLSEAPAAAHPWVLELDPPAHITPADTGWPLELPSASRLRVIAAEATAYERHGTVVVRANGTASVLLATADEPAPATSHADTTQRTQAVTHADHLRATEQTWSEWFARCPIVREDLQSMARDCWWVLGANIVELAGHANARAVVPSKIGYVGLWQWDAYFIALGLRHGDPELAREQLDLALRYPTGEGQLPDVVHDEGVLASSDDLPPKDLENLRRAGSAVVDPDAAVPLTKPPLTAWAIAKVAETIADPSWEQWAYSIAARSQGWWFRLQDSDGDGLPEYSHPYSSGLDDNPIFDQQLPVASPDLTTYLIVQDELLAEHEESIGRTDDAARHRARAQRTLELLLQSWNEAKGFFPATAGTHELRAYTAVSLLPLLTGRLPDPMRRRILSALDDPALFATPLAVPTVSASDPDFSAEQMWRGPVWVNINALLVEGLRASDEPERARTLAEQTVRMVIDGGGPSEYFDPRTGAKAAGATTAFGWSAALFIDLAVSLSD